MKIVFQQINIHVKMGSTDEALFSEDLMCKSSEI